MYEPRPNPTLRDEAMRMKAIPAALLTLALVAGCGPRVSDPPAILGPAVLILPDQVVDPVTFIARNPPLGG